MKYAKIFVTAATAAVIVYVLANYGWADEINTSDSDAVIRGAGYLAIAFNVLAAGLSIATMNSESRKASLGMSALFAVSFVVGLAYSLFIESLLVLSIWSFIGLSLGISFTLLEKDIYSTM